MVAATGEALRRREETKVERELEALCRRLLRWKEEIAAHREAIAEGNFAIGVDIHLFFQKYPPRRHRGMDLIGRLSRVIGRHRNYLRVMVAVSAWLHEDLGVRDLRTYMRRENLRSWKQVTDRYLAERGSSSKGSLMLTRRFVGLQRSLGYFKEALPTQHRKLVSQFLRQMDQVVREIVEQQRA